MDNDTLNSAPGASIGHGWRAYPSTATPPHLEIWGHPISAAMAEEWSDIGGYVANIIISGLFIVALIAVVLIGLWVLFQWVRKEWS